MHFLKQVFLPLLVGLILSSPLHASSHLRSMVVFGDSLSDTGNTTHLLKSLRSEESPAYLVRPFKVFVVHRMEDFANDYYIPQYILDAGIEIVEDFFDQELGPMLANLISDIRKVPVLPGEPYWQDHFSNGRIWAEYLAPMIKIDREDLRQFDIQAFGGSWAVTYDYQLTTWNLIKHPIATLKTLVVGKLIPPSLGLTVQAWLLTNDGVSSDDLVFVFTGGNDYLNVLTFEANYDPSVMSTYIDNVLDGIEYSVEKLIQHGAEQLVVMNLPDISTTPKVIHSLDAPYLKEVVNIHNHRLAQRVEDWRKFHPDVKFVLIDIPKLMNQVVLNPQQHGFIYTDKACIDVKLPMFNFKNTPFQSNPVLNLAQEMSTDISEFGRDRRNYHRCDDEEHYLFWDEIHPTTKAHHWFAYHLCEVLANEGYEANCTIPA